MITLENLSYSYRKDRMAISGITARIGTGIHLLLGENGAGKTTLLHLIAGLLRTSNPEECLIDGESPSLRPPTLMSRMFMVSDDMHFPFPTIDDMVKYHAPFYPSFDAEMLRRNLEAFGMTGRESISTFSLGNRKKAILAYAFALRAEVLLLDEPANGLDISARQNALGMMAECIDENQTVIISTHSVFDFRPLFESVLVLSSGHLILNRPVWEIAERIDFVTDKFPPENALYIEQSLGQFRAIVPHTPDSDVTDIDFLMLYNALHSRDRMNLINLINSAEQ